MKSSVLLLSIRPEYAEKIFDGTKKVELRRIRPRLLEGDSVLVYISSPKKVLFGSLEVEKVIQKCPFELWDLVQDIAGITREEFDNYYDGADVGFGIFLRRIQIFRHPIELAYLQQKWLDFRPPQSYRYLQPDEINLVETITKSKFTKFHQSALDLSIKN